MVLPQDPSTKATSGLSGLDPSNLYGGSKDDEEIVDEHEIELEAKLKHCFLHPNSKIRETWDAIQALLLIYVLFVVPFRTCFGE